MSSIPYPSPSDIPYPSTPDLSPALSRQKTSVQSSPEDWKEMKDPNTGRSYWVNHVTRQMSYNPPARKTSPPSSGANNALGLSRLDELLERYEKITAQNRTMKEEKVTTEPDTLASPLLIKTQATHAQRGAAPPPRDASMLPSPASGKPAVSPASGKPAVSPSSLFASNPVRENERRSEMHGPSYDSEVRQNFVRIQANKIPNSVDLLEAYVHQPNALLDLPPSVPERDPLIRLYGLSMFVDNYAPATEARSETTTISQADAILADLQKILQHDLLRGHDIGSTRQIGDTKKKPAQFNNLAAQAVSAGKAKATRAAVPAKPATAEASASEYSAYSAFHRNAVRPAAKVVAAIDVAGAQAPAKTSTSQTARTEDEIPLVSGAEDQLFVSREVAIMPMELGPTDGPDGTLPAEPTAPGEQPSTVGAECLM